MRLVPTNSSHMTGVAYAPGSTKFYLLFGNSCYEYDGGQEAAMANTRTKNRSRSRIQHRAREDDHDDRDNRIQREIENSMRYYAHHPKEISERLSELDEEWDIERALQAGAAGVAFYGTAMAAIGRKRGLLLPALAAGFLFQHALQGWSAPVEVLRYFGFRSSDEIEQERSALKALRGDFEKVTTAPDPVEAAVQATSPGPGSR